MIDGKSGITLTSKEWSNTDSKELNFPYSVMTSANLPDSLPIWSWQIADKLDLDSDRNDAIKIIKELRDAFQNQNANRFFELNEQFYIEMKDMYPDSKISSLKDRKTRLISDLKSYAEEDNWHLNEIDVNNLSLRLCGNNRLIECIAKDWLPIIRTSKPDSYGQIFYYKAFIGKIKNKWTVFRSSQYYERA